MRNMRFRRKEHLLRNTDLLHKKAGKTEWLLGLFLMQFLIVIIVSEMQMIKYRSVSDYLEDAIAASGLASALIDGERYGKDKVVEISDPYLAYDAYKTALHENIKGISNEVIIERYCIYNVEDFKVEIISINDTGKVDCCEGILGEVRAPNGEVIRSTGVYSEISFPVEGIFGITSTAQKGKLIEINKTDIGGENEEH